MGWRKNVEAAVLAVKSARADRVGANRDAEIEQKRAAAAEVLATHAALKDLLPTSTHWYLRKLDCLVPFTTAHLLLHLIDGLIAYAERTGVECAVRDCDALLKNAEANELPGYDLTFFEGFKTTECWNLAQGLYVGPFDMVRKRLSGRLERRDDPFTMEMDPEVAQSLSVMVKGFRWGPLIVPSTRVIPPFRFESHVRPTFDHDPTLLVALLAVTSSFPLSVRVETQLAAPWVEDLLNLEGRLSSHSPTTRVLVPPPPREVGKQTKRAIEQAFSQWNGLSGRAEDTLALAVTRLAASLSRRGPLAAQDSVLDISIALEILYQLGPGEITFKLSSRAGWYLGRDAETRKQTATQMRDFYGLRSRIAHGGRSKNLDHQKLQDQAFGNARATLLKHLARGSIPSDDDWSRIVLGAVQEPVPPN